MLFANKLTHIHLRRHVACLCERADQPDFGQAHNALMSKVTLLQMAALLLLLILAHVMHEAVDSLLVSACLSRMLPSDHTGIHI